MNPMRITAAAACIVAVAATASASIVLRVTPRELADEAHVVVEGRVSAVDVRWDDEHTTINHYVTFNVERTHKGKAGATVTIVVPGGTVGEDTLRVDGVPEFRDGDEAVVFLWQNRHGELVVLGQAQGKFDLLKDRKSGARMAQNSLKGLCLVTRGAPGATRAAATTRPDYVTYDSLVETVQLSVKEAATKDAEERDGTAGNTGSGTSGTTTGSGTGAGTGTGTVGGASGSGDGSVTPGSGGDGSATGTGTGTGTEGTKETPGQDPATPKTQPDPPTTTPSSDEAPPPKQDDPAPPAGTPDSGAGG